VQAAAAGAGGIDTAVRRPLRVGDADADADADASGGAGTDPSGDGSIDVGWGGQLADLADGCLGEVGDALDADPGCAQCREVLTYRCGDTGAHFVQ
jgi:hypothetical protein